MSANAQAPVVQAPPTPAQGPPIVLILGIIGAIIVVIIILWKTGVFNSTEPDVVSSGPGPSPGPMAPGPSSMSENVMNIKNFYDDVFSGSCPDATTKMATYMDSIGGFKGVKGSCPEGTLFSMKNTDPASKNKNSQYDVCIMNQDAIQKLNNAPQEIQDLTKNCKSAPKNDDKIKRSEPTCNCPQGSTYVSSGLPSQRCINDSTKQSSEESCNCPDGFTYLAADNDPGKRCALLNNKIEAHDSFPGVATILK